MPEISRFYGIRIIMYPNDHQPPHFHAIYAEDQAVIGIAANWVRLRSGQSSLRVPPLL